MNYKVSTSHKGWVEHTRSFCVLDTFATRIQDCRRVLPLLFSFIANNFLLALQYFEEHFVTRVCERTVCLQIFVPMWEKGVVDHWYLLVVHPKEKYADILDSAPHPDKDDERKSVAKFAVESTSPNQLNKAVFNTMTVDAT